MRRPHKLTNRATVMNAIKASLYWLEAEKWADDYNWKDGKATSTYATTIDADIRKMRAALRIIRDARFPDET
jgi:hypothetical protein